MATNPIKGYPGYRGNFTCAEVISAGTANAGILVEMRTGVNLIGVAGALSAKVVGVAIDDVPASAAYVGGPKVGDGNECTVYSGGKVNVIAAATILTGALLVAAAGGQVTPYISGTHDASLIVGRACAAAAAAGTVPILLSVGCC